MGPINSYEFPAPFATVQNDFTLMAWCCTVEAPLLMHWSRCSLALPGLRLDVHFALYRSCKNYAYHWHVSFLCFNELMLRDYSAIPHWFCICLCVTVAIKTSWILNLEATFTGSPSYSSVTHRCMIWKGPGKQYQMQQCQLPGQAITVCGIPVRGVMTFCLMFALKNSADVNFANQTW